MGTPVNTPPGSPPSIRTTTTPAPPAGEGLNVASVSNPSDPMETVDPLGAGGTQATGQNVQFALFKSGVIEACEKLDLPKEGFEKSILKQMHTNKGSLFLSPEATGKQVSIGAEPVRSILRHQRLGLLEKSENEKAQHKIFVKNQPEALKLTLESFKTLQTKFQCLTSEQMAAAKVSAVLKPSVEKTEKYKEKRQELPKDPEQYLTKVAQLASVENVSFMPAIDPLSPDKRKCLEQCFPTDAHFRHFFFSENGLKELQGAIQSIQSLDAFQMWEARWWVDLMGFDREQYGVTQPIFDRAQSLFSLIKDAVKGKIQTSRIMPTYLTALQQSSGLNKNESYKTLDHNQQAVITQVIAYFEHTTPEQCENIVKGYMSLSEEIKQNLPTNYQSFLVNLKAESPTYLPAVIKTANEQFLTLDPDKDENKAMQNAAVYTFKMLDAVYKAIDTKPETIVSARDAAFPGHWTKDKNTWAKSYLENKISFVITETGAIDTQQS